MDEDEILRWLNISTDSTFYKKIVGWICERKTNSSELKLFRFLKISRNNSNLLISMLTAIGSWLPASSNSQGVQTSTDLWSGSISGGTLGESNVLGLSSSDEKLRRSVVSINAADDSFSRENHLKEKTLSENDKISFETRRIKWTVFHMREMSQWTGERIFLLAYWNDSTNPEERKRMKIDRRPWKNCYLKWQRGSDEKLIMSFIIWSRLAWFERERSNSVDGKIRETFRDGFERRIFFLDVLSWEKALTTPSDFWRFIHYDNRDNRLKDHFVDP